MLKKLAKVKSKKSKLMKGIHESGAGKYLEKGEVPDKIVYRKGKYNKRK